MQMQLSVVVLREDILIVTKCRLARDSNSHVTDDVALSTCFSRLNHANGKDLIWFLIKHEKNMPNTEQ